MRKREVKARTVPRRPCTLCMHGDGELSSVGHRAPALGPAALRCQVTHSSGRFSKYPMNTCTSEAFTVTRSLRFGVSVTKTQLKHLFKFGLAQLFEWMIKIELSSQGTIPSSPTPCHYSQGKKSLVQNQPFLSLQLLTKCNKCTNHSQPHHAQRDYHRILNHSGVPLSSHVLKAMLKTQVRLWGGGCRTAAWAQPARARPPPGAHTRSRCPASRLFETQVVSTSKAWCFSLFSISYSCHKKKKVCPEKQFCP